MTAPEVNALSEEQINDFKCHLDFFEGPLDLLLYLIKKSEIDIQTVRLETITQQYLEHLQLMRSLDMDVAGEFIVTAATLLHIKSRALLPGDVADAEEGEEEEDPHQDLLQKLLEYKQFKEASGHLEELQEKEQTHFDRGVNVLPPDRESKIVTEAGVFDLFKAFQDLLKKIKLKSPREVIADKFTVEEKMRFLRSEIREKGEIRFSSLINEDSPKDEIICIFLGILELVKMQEIFIEQQGKVFGEIVLRPRKAPPSSPQEEKGTTLEHTTGPVGT